MMLSTTRVAPAASALRGRAQPQSAARPSGRCVVTRFKRDKEVEQEAKKLGPEDTQNLLKQVRRDLYSTDRPSTDPQSVDRPNSDPQSVDGPVKDVSELPLSSIGKFETQEINAYKAPGLWLVPSFTRRREVLAGRLAILGFAAACAWEVINPSHPGPMAAASMLTGLSQPTINVIFAGFGAHGLLGLVGWGGPTYSLENRRDVALRPKGFPSSWINPFTSPFTFLGIDPSWGFTKKNELFVGRLAMLGMAAAVAREFPTGQGPLGQIAGYFGNIPSEQYFNDAGRILVAWSVLAFTLAYVSGNLGEYKGDESVY